MRRCLELHYSSSQNQEQVMSANAYKLKSMFDIAPHVKDFQEQRSTWTYATKNSLHLLRTGDINPDQGTAFLPSRPQSFSTDESLAEAMAYLRCQQSNSWKAHSAGYGNDKQVLCRDSHISLNKLCQTNCLLSSTSLSSAS